MTAQVVRAEPPTLLEYTLGTDLLRWELAATDTGSRLTLRHTVQDRDWIPKVAAGWHLCLDVAEKLLDGHPISPIRGAAAVDFGWSELNDQYAQKFGIPNTGLPEHVEDADEPTCEGLTSSRARCSGSANLVAGAWWARPATSRTPWSPVSRPAVRGSRVSAETDALTRLPRWPQDRWWSSGRRATGP